MPAPGTIRERSHKLLIWFELSTHGHYATDGHNDCPVIAMIGKMRSSQWIFVTAHRTWKTVAQRAQRIWLLRENSLLIAALFRRLTGKC